jgi:O-antigen/teichoic acid export membrane protein
MVLPLISRLFGAEAYGIWSQIGITIALLVPILSLRLEAALVRYTSGLRSSKEKTQAIFSSLLATLIVGTCALIIGFVARQTLAIAMFADSALSAYVVLSFGLLLARSAMSVCLAYHRAHSRIAFYTAVQTGLALLEFLGLLISAWIVRSSFEVALLVILAIDAAVLLLLVVDILRRERRVAFSPSLLAKLLRYSLPLVPAIALAWVVSASDRYVIVHYLGLAQSGAYSAAYRMAQILGMLVHPILFVLFPLAATLWDQGERSRTGRYLSDALRWFAVLALPATAGLVAVGSLSMQLISGGVFITTDLLIALLTISEILMGVSLIYNLALYLEEKTWIQPLLFLGIGGLNLSLNLLWIPQLGILGAALSTCLCRLAQIIVVVTIARRIVHAPIPWGTIVKASIASVGVYFVASSLPFTGLMGLVLRVLAGVVTYMLLAAGLGVVQKRDIEQLRHR